MKRGREIREDKSCSCRPAFRRMIALPAFPTRDVTWAGRNGPDDGPARHNLTFRASSRAQPLAWTGAGWMHAPFFYKF